MLFFLLLLCKQVLLFAALKRVMCEKKKFLACFGAVIVGHFFKNRIQNVLTFGVIKLFIRNSSAFSFHSKLNSKKLFLVPSLWNLLMPSLWDLFKLFLVPSLWNRFKLLLVPSMWNLLVPSLWDLLQLFDVSIITLFQDFLLY